LFYDKFGYIAVSLTALIIIVWLITRLNRINKSIFEKNKQFEELKLSFRGSAASSENQVHIGNQINSSLIISPPVD